MKITGISNLAAPLRQNKINFKANINDNLSSSEMDRFLGIKEDTFEKSDKKVNYSLNILNKNGMYNGKEYCFYSPLTGETPVLGILIKRKTSKGKQLFVHTTSSNETVPFNGCKRQRDSEGKIIEEVRYINGFPSIRSKFKNGIVYEREQFDSHTHEKVYVKRTDNSFTLMQLNSPSGRKIELETRNPDNNEVLKIYAFASKVNHQNSVFKCHISSPDLYETIGIQCNYPDLKFKSNGYFEDMDLLKKSLMFMQKTINSDSYVEDFGRDKNLNTQLKEAIKYLDNQAK